MGRGGPHATRIPENPVGRSGISPDDGRSADTGPPPARSPRRLAGLLLPPLAVMGVVFLLSAQPNLNSGLREDFFLRKCAHVTEYVVLTLLWARALAGLWPDLGARRAAAGAATIALLWAASDEWHQTFVEGRVGAVHDVGIDAIGMAIALVLLWRTRLGVLLGVRPPQGDRDA